MKRFYSSRNFAAFVLVWTVLLAPLASFAQTPIKLPKNKYKVQDDVKLGRDYSAQVEKEMPILRDAESTAYLESVGRKLVSNIPPEFQQPAFQYSFKIVNASDINAFALPGGPMYVNRGMIEAAKTEGEMAGVMAHEISHVALRHSTAQATAQSNPLKQILGGVATIGGGLILGETGAQLGQTLYQGLLVLPYSRSYETQSDTLGAQILARAGYDPRDLANMFRTIEKQSGGGGGAPEFLSTHPSPENRYQKIDKEASMLNVSPNPIKITPGFERIQAKMRKLPRAKSMKEIDEENKRNGGGNNNGNTGNTENPMAGGRYENTVDYPSSQIRNDSPANFLQLSVPDNWQSFPSKTEVTYAPEGAYGDQGITRGAMIGVFKPQSQALNEANNEFVKGVLQGNNYLKQNSASTRTTISGRQAFSTVLSGTSPVTGKTEMATVYTTTLSDGSLLYVVTVAPQSEAANYNIPFRNMIRSIRLNDQ